MKLYILKIYFEIILILNENIYLKIILIPNAEDTFKNNFNT